MLFLLLFFFFLLFCVFLPVDGIHLPTLSSFSSASSSRLAVDGVHLSTLGPRAPPHRWHRVTHLVFMSFSQLTLTANMTPANQWTLRLPSSESVQPVMTFDPSDRNYLYVMTSHHVSAPPFPLSQPISDNQYLVLLQVASSHPSLARHFFAPTLDGILLCVSPHNLAPANSKTLFFFTQMIVGCLKAFIIRRGNRWDYPMLFKQLTD